MSPLAKIALVKEEGRTGLCAHPLKFRRMWTDQGTRGKIPAAFWRPIPPPRYRCLGDLVTIDYSPPPARAVVCLHWSVVRKSVPGERVWWDIGSEAFDDVSLWGIRTAAGCAAVNTFLVLETYMKPSRTDGPTPPSPHPPTHPTPSPPHTHTHPAPLHLSVLGGMSFFLVLAVSSLFIYITSNNLTATFSFTNSVWCIL